MSKVAVIGAGAMGLAAAYHLAKAGHQVKVFESDEQPGGMAAHFDFGGISIERFYHFICKSDAATFELLDELGLGDKLIWRPTSMGYYFDGKLYPWGDPLALLRFPHLSLIEKFRYGLHAFISSKRSDWRKLDGVAAHDWIQRWIGRGAYEKLWESLFYLKFYEYSENISAAWVWTRIKRIANSRKSIFQEELGYIEGGSETLVNRLVERITALGGEIATGTGVERIELSGDRVAGVTTKSGFEAFDEVISTVPVPLIPQLIPDLPQDLLAKYRALDNIAVVCVMHKLNRCVTRNFWVNINDELMDIPGIIEFSNLRPVDPHHIVYIPYYMPATNPKYGLPDEKFIEQTKQYLMMINRDLSEDNFIDSKVGRLRYAQPVCPPRFLEMLPPVQTGIEGLQIADTSYYYPEDRGISESVRLARIMADAVSVQSGAGCVGSIDSAPVQEREMVS